MSKNLLTYVAEAIDRYHIERQTPRDPDLPPAPSNRWTRWLPTRGNVVFSMVLVAGLVLAGRAGALTLGAPAASSTAVIPYQGRLANADGSPFTGPQNMEFRLYAAPAGGTPLWAEFWTGPNAVNVSDGLFSVLLGSLNTGLAGVVQANGQAYLGVTVGTDAEMAPRVQLGSAAYAMQALTVPDGSIGTAKLADGAVTTAKIVDGSVTTAKIGTEQVISTSLADSAITSAKIADGQVMSADVSGGAITTTKIADNAIRAEKISNGGVPSEKLKLQSGTTCLSAPVTVSSPGNYQPRNVPGLTLAFTLTRPSKVLVWMEGLANFTQPSNDEGDVALLIDGVSQVGSITVDREDAWFHVKGQRIIDLAAGGHSMNMVVGSHQSGSFYIEGVDVYRTCIYYLVLGEQ